MIHFLPSRVDVSVGNGAWTDVDDSNVPDGASGVLLMIVNTGFASHNVGFRKKGSTDNRTNVLYYSGGIVFKTMASIGVDASGVFQLYQSNAAIKIYLVGYYDSEVVFFTNAVDKSTSTTNSWLDIDISGDVGSDDAIGAIFEVRDTGNTSSRSLGMRKKGSTDNRDRVIASHTSFIIGLDGSKICQQKISSSNVDVFLVGYIKSGAVFNTNATDVSVGSAGSFVDMAALPEGAMAGIIEAYDSTGSYYPASLRKKGASEDDYKPTQHSTYVVEADSSRIISAKVYNTALKLFLVGTINAPQTAPTIAPNTDDAHSFSTDQPTIEFTGTDADSDDLEYEIQIDTVDTFDSQGVVDNALSLADNGSLYADSDLVDDDISFFGWIKKNTSSDSQEIFFNGVNGSYGEGYSFRINSSNKLCIDLAYLAELASSFDLNGDYEWHFVGFTRSSGTWTIYFDGASEVVGTTSPYGMSSGAKIMLGAKNNDGTPERNFNGYMARFGYWTSVLNSTQIAALLAGATVASIGGADIDLPLNNSGAWGTNSGAVGNFSIDGTLTLSTDQFDALPLGALIDALSETDAGFANEDTPADTHPFNSGDLMGYTVQSGDALADDTYYWRARTKDPSGTDTWSDWTTTRSFDISLSSVTYVSISDTGSSSDIISALVGIIPQTDSASASDVAAVLGKIPQTDSGVGLDSQSIRSSIQQTDSGAGVDTDPAITNPIAITDSAVGTDLLSIVVALLQQETGTGAEVANIVASFLLSDSASASDIATVAASIISTSDAGAGADALTVAARLQITDTGAGNDVPSIKATIALLESAVGADLVAILAKIGVFDISTGDDTATMKGIVSITESGAGAEALAILATMNILDFATGSEVISLLSIISQMDSSVGADLISILNRLAILDNVAGDDQEYFQKQIIISESGLGDDASSIITEILLSDDGVGAESVIRLWVRIYSRVPRVYSKIAGKFLKMQTVYKPKI